MKVSIVIPTWNGEDVLEECLSGIFRQEVDFEFDVLLIDSSSTDRTLEIARRYPVKIHVISQSEFSHGDTRNLGVLLTAGERIVFLVQDAYPERNDWLRRLVSNLDDPEVAGAYSRVLPRPSAGPLVKKGVEGDLNYRSERLVQQMGDEQAYRALDSLQRRILTNFNDVASCLRRSAWERLPYARVPFGEDVLWARSAIEAGYKIVFDPEAPVIHSHEYDARTLRARTRIDAWFNRACLDRICVARKRDIITMTRRSAAADRIFLEEVGVPPREVRRWQRRSYLYHFLEFLGFYQGGRTADRLSVPKAVEKKRLKILFVVHGFPPETTAGTEVLTFSLARALQRRGHEVIVFHRVADQSMENYAVSEGTYEGLRVIRIANHLDYGNIQQTFHNHAVEEAFRGLLRRERPDVVHFEHLIHLSAALPRICRAEGVPSVLTLNDFWFRCPTVQLIRPNRRVCSGKPPILGCFACVSHLPALVPLVRFLSRPFRRPLAGIARRYLSVMGRPCWFLTKRLSDIAWLSLRPETMVRELLAADFIIAPSPFLKSKMIESGVPKDRLIVSDYGMETGWLERYERTDSQGRVRFGFIGSLVWYKGLRVLARAFQRLEGEAAELHIFGDTESMEPFRKTRAEIERSVTRPGLFFHGRYETDRLGEVLGSLDVLVVPSIWYENSPLAIHEAFQARVPVLVSDRGGMRDLVRDGAGGLRFRAGSDRDLARVMERFLKEPELAASLVRAAPAVKTVEQNAAEMELKYRQAIGLGLGRLAEIPLGLEQFDRSSAVVEQEKDGWLLLRSGEVSARFEVEDEVSLELSLQVCHRAGATCAEQVGEVLLDGKRLLQIDPCRGEAAERLDRYLAPARLRAGAHRLLIRGGTLGNGDSVLRFGRVGFYRTSTPLFW
ncbi:MAG: glycosyltransferase [Planctomycetota bacterium]